MNDDTLRNDLRKQILGLSNAVEIPNEARDAETTVIHIRLVDVEALIHAHDQALRDRLLAAIPVVTMNELLDAKQLPKKVATYKKMVWMQNYYRDKCTAAIASVLNDKEK
jgi:hypothetical protein